MQDIKLSAFVNAVRQQRDSALDAVANLQGELAAKNEEIKKLKAEIDTLRKAAEPVKEAAE